MQSELRDELIRKIERQEFPEVGGPSPSSHSKLLYREP